MGSKHSKTDVVKETTNRATVESLKSNAKSIVLSQGNRISQNTVTFDTDDLEIGTDFDNYAPKKSSMEEIISMKSNSSYVSNKSNVSNKSQKKRKSRKPEDLRKIRDKPNRMCRKASTAPDQAFIVEEALLEDLCAIAGEEAHDGGNIIMSREKEELIRRLSRNQATADIFKNTKNIRKFSTNSIRGDYTTGTLVNTSIVNNDKSLSNVSSSHHSSKHTTTTGSVLTTGSILTTGSLLTSSISLNPEQIQDPTKLRRQSIKQIQKTSPKTAHELMTQANYRTEIQALKMAQKRETCSCFRTCFALCNIYI